MKSASLVIALAGILLVCMAGVASAHEFVNKPEKSGFIGKGGAQTITLGSTTVSCKAATIDGHATSTQLYIEIDYETCEAFSKVAEVDPIRLLLLADGSGRLADSSSIFAHLGSTSINCTFNMLVTSQPTAAVKFTTNALLGITINSALRELSYELKEKGTSACGEDGEIASNGEYKGEVKTETYKGAKCVFYGPGGLHEPLCSGEGTGWWEEVAGYSTLEWS